MQRAQPPRELIASRTRRPRAASRFRLRPSSPLPSNRAIDSSLQTGCESARGLTSSLEACVGRTRLRFTDSVPASRPSSSTSFALIGCILLLHVHGLLLLKHQASCKGSASGRRASLGSSAMQLTSLECGPAAFRACRRLWRSSRALRKALKHLITVHKKLQAASSDRDVRTCPPSLRCLSASGIRVFRRPTAFVARRALAKCTSRPLSSEPAFERPGSRRRESAVNCGKSWLVPACWHALPPR